MYLFLHCKLVLGVDRLCFDGATEGVDFGM